jgi:transcriptional regulator with XRE-family HTH domain
MSGGDIMESFWDRVRELLRIHGMTMADLSKVLDLSPSFLSVSMNRNSPAKAEVALNIADYFGVSFRWLVSGEDKDSIDPKYAIVLDNKKVMDLAYCLISQSEEFISIINSLVLYENSKSKK